MEIRLILSSRISFVSPRKKKRKEYAGPRLYLVDSSGIEGQSTLFVKWRGHFEGGGKLRSVLPPSLPTFMPETRGCKRSDMSL